MKSLITLSLAAFAVSSSLQAGGHASEMQERMDLMSSIGKQTRPLGQMARSGDVDWEAVAAAGANTSMVAEKFAELLVEGTYGAPGSANGAAIEANKDDILAQLAALGETGAGLSAAAEAQDVDAYKAAFGAYAGTCRSCHMAYRQ